MTINVSTLGGGGGAGFKLAPDLNYMANTLGSGITTITGIDATTKTNVLTLTGKFAITQLFIANLLSTASVEEVELVIDGVTIIDDATSIPARGTQATTSLGIIGRAGANANGSELNDTAVISEESLALSLRVSGDADIAIAYVARPIL